MQISIKSWLEARHNYRASQCYESHIGEVILKGRLYKDLGSPTPIASFWGMVLPRTYTRNKWCFHWESANWKGLLAEGFDQQRSWPGSSEASLSEVLQSAVSQSAAIGTPPFEGWQYYESHIGEVILRRKPPIANFWGTVLPRTYACNKLWVPHLGDHLEREVL